MDERFLWASSVCRAVSACSAFCWRRGRRAERPREDGTVAWSVGRYFEGRVFFRSVATWEGAGLSVRLSPKCQNRARSSAFRVAALARAQWRSVHCCVPVTAVTAASSVLAMAFSVVYPERLEMFSSSHEHDPHRFHVD